MTYSHRLHSSSDHIYPGSRLETMLGCVSEVSLTLVINLTVLCLYYNAHTQQMNTDCSETSRAFSHLLTSVL